MTQHIAQGDTVQSVVEQLPPEGRSGVEAMQSYLHGDRLGQTLRHYYGERSSGQNAQERMGEMDTAIERAAQSALRGELGEEVLFGGMATGIHAAKENLRYGLEWLSQGPLNMGGNYHSLVSAVRSKGLGEPVHLPEWPGTDETAKAAYKKAYEDAIVTGMALGSDTVRLLGPNGSNEGFMRRVFDKDHKPTGAWLRVNSGVTRRDHKPEDFDMWNVSIIVPPNGKDVEFTPEMRERSLAPVKTALESIEAEAASGEKSSPLVQELIGQRQQADYHRSLLRPGGYESAFTHVELGKHPERAVTDLPFGEEQPITISAGAQSFSLRKTEQGIFLQNESLRNAMLVAVRNIDPTLPAAEKKEYQQRLMEEIDDRTSVRVRPGEPLNIGREGSDVPVVSGDDLMSRDHFSIVVAEDGTVAVQDRGLNGTEVNYHRGDLTEYSRSQQETNEKLWNLQRERAEEAPQQVQAAVHEVQARRGQRIRRAARRVIPRRRTR